MKPLAICIAGPTATGKTQAAVAVAKALQGEVISMDSMQIYQGMDIGTAKASAEEMQGIPHHLLSFVPPGENYTVADYQRDAKACMQAILARNHLPIFAGGTNLYLQAVSRPLTFTQAVGSPEFRLALEQEAEKPGGAQRVWEQLREVDPQRADELHVNNTRRVIRALEVFHITGQRMSEQSKDWEGEPDEDWLIYALTWPREVLYDRINRRVDIMAQSGLFEEVEGLLAAGIPPEAQSMKAIGYKEVVTALSGQCTRQEAIEAIKLNTRHYAKRQLTWLRREARVRWVDLSQFADMQAVHAHLISDITKYREDRSHDGY